MPRPFTALFPWQPWCDQNILCAPGLSGAQRCHTTGLFSATHHLTCFCSTADSPAATRQVLGKKPPFQFIEAGLLRDLLRAIIEFTENICQKPNLVVSGGLGLPCRIMSQHFFLWPTEMWFGQQTIAQCEIKPNPFTSQRGTQESRPLKFLASSQKSARKTRSLQHFCVWC